jgi:hypothetical protein
MMLAGSAFAATTPAAAPAKATKPAAQAAAKPAAVTAAPAKTVAKKPAASAASHKRLVKAKLSNGKTVTYDCSLAGNKTKQACKG